MEKILLDARELEYPKPLQISIEYLSEMKSNEYLYMLNRKNPIPLLEIAKGRGFQYLSHQDSNEIWHIIITKNKSIELKGLLDV